MPSTDDDRRIIREELDRLLSSPQFRNSKRYPSFLRHVVEETLAGRSALLKERTLAVDLFERSADYDTSSDHIVRSTAVEIRKRITQYYQEAGEPSHVRIDLPPGAYVPEFRLGIHLEPVIFPSSSSVIAESPRLRKFPFLWFLLAVVTAGAVATLLLFEFRPRPISPDESLAEFWEPLLSSSGSVTFSLSGPLPCCPAPNTQTAGIDKPTSFGGLHQSMDELVSIADADAVARITAFLGQRQKNFRIRHSPVSLSDLRQGPIILIGGLNNEWTMRLTEGRRFRFEQEFVAVPGNTSRRFWIGDRLHPDKRDWSFDFGKPASEMVDDYALISRLWDSTVGAHLVTVAGLAKYGTVAASEFLTDSGRFAEFARHAPSGWSKKNLQIVIRTKVIGAHAGSPEILAVNVW